MSNSVPPQRRQPTRLCRPWDSPGKNTGVGCHFLLQCMKVKSEREVAQSCLTLRDPMDCSLLGSSIHGIFQARVLEWVAIVFSKGLLYQPVSPKCQNTHSQEHVHAHADRYTERHRDASENKHAGARAPIAKPKQAPTRARAVAPTSQHTQTCTHVCTGMHVCTHVQIKHTLRGTLTSTRFSS